ncbi:MAG: HIRAN domain-containing protein [Flavobacteriales bacterium]|nr:HIRAN domain-containing protein [Flavobacteriales bacterium]MCL4281589.1 HIRAN domain-containing protein [Flavobacteriales bacterium]
MDRITFLKRLMGGTALLTLPPWTLLSAKEQDRLAWTKDSHSVFVFDSFVRGFQYHDGAKVIHRMKAQDPLDLVREHGNEHDSNAVAVYWEGHKLGYLPMGENISLAAMLDHGLLLEAEVAYTAPELPPWEQCFFSVYLLLPSTPSFDAYLDEYMARPDAGYKLRPEYGGEEDAPPTGI